MFLNLLHEISQRQERFIFNSLKARFWEGKSKGFWKKRQKSLILSLKGQLKRKTKQKKKQILKASFGTLQ